jgi:superfamily II DNA or RNA helicase
LIQIELNNNQFKLSGDLKVLNKLYKAMKVKHPNRFFIKPYMPQGWDGCIDYITERGYCKTGLFPKVTSLIKSLNKQYSIIDSRKLLEYEAIPSKILDFTPRYYQYEAVSAIVNNNIGGINFPRGVIAAATNAGKTIIAAMLFLSYRNAKALILLNNKPLYEQFLEDMPKFFGDNWGYMQGKNVRWADIMVCMTPTLKGNLRKYSSKLATYNMLLFDECHLVTSKTNKTVIAALYNTIVRVGLSGTPFDHKDPTKNLDVEAFFGPSVYTIKNITLMEEGYSAPIVIKVIKGNTLISIPGNYREEYNQGIIFSEEREKALLWRLSYYIKRGLFPILIIGKFHDHVERMYEIIYTEFGDKYSVNYLHHKVKDRKNILDDFKSGKLDILIASQLIKLGQNMPLIRTMINASSGDSHIVALQLLGRAIRTHESKEKVYYEDFFDMGKYLQKHSRHRINYYISEKFKVIFLEDKIKKLHFRYSRKIPKEEP